MSGFWMWFWRPFAEMLAGIAILIAVVLIYALILLCKTTAQWWRARK